METEVYTFPVVSDDVLCTRVDIVTLSDEFPQSAVVVTTTHVHVVYIYWSSQLHVHVHVYTYVICLLFEFMDCSITKQLLFVCNYHRDQVP